MRARVVARVVHRLHRQVDQDLVAVAAAAVDPLRQAFGEGREGERHRPRKRLDRALRRLFRYAEAGDDDGDARPLVHLAEGAGIDPPRRAPVLADDRQRAEVALLDQQRVGMRVQPSRGELGAGRRP